MIKQYVDGLIGHVLSHVRNQITESAIISWFQTALSFVNDHNKGRFDSAMRLVNKACELAQTVPACVREYFRENGDNIKVSAYSYLEKSLLPDGKEIDGWTTKELEAWLLSSQKANREIVEKALNAKGNTSPEFIAAAIKSDNSLVHESGLTALRHFIHCDVT